MSEYQFITHPFPPYYDVDSEILILGSFPSVKSREQMFFYGHPQNRFWKVLGAVYQQPVPGTIEEKRAFLGRNHIALWDVIGSCEIIGSSDSSIRNVTPTDLGEIIRNSKVQRIYNNGQTSGKLYKKYQQNILGMEAVVLPSTSPANAAYTLDKLVKEWGQIISHGNV